MLLKEASALFQALEKDFFSDLKGAKFNYAMIRNKSILKSELALIESSFKPPEKYYEYDSKRIAILRELADKDEKGNPVIENNNFKVSPEAEKIFLEKLEGLKEEFKDTLDERELQAKAFEELLEEPVKFEMHTIHIDNIPDEVSQDQMDILYPLIIAK